jgi:hypothetical protein
MKMKTVAIALLAIFASVMVGTGSAWAGTPAPVQRYSGNQTFSGQCCVLFNETVGVSEPAKQKPVLVIWDTAYSPGTSDESLAGLSVNGGPCQTAVYGADVMPAYDLTDDPGAFIRHITFQWVILPSDGVLKAGANSFELCGGGNSSDDSLTIYNNTLSAFVY